jgi:hypothetical protein
MDSYGPERLEAIEAYVLFAVAFLGNLAILCQEIYRRFKRRGRRILPRMRGSAHFTKGRGKADRTPNVLPRKEVSHEKSDSSPSKPSGRLPEA